MLVDNPYSKEIIFMILVLARYLVPIMAVSMFSWLPRIQESLFKEFSIKGD